jgi:hypothetical protein
MRCRAKFELVVVAEAMHVLSMPNIDINHAGTFSMRGLRA